MELWMMLMGPLVTMATMIGLLIGAWLGEVLDEARRYRWFMWG